MTHDKQGNAMTDYDGLIRTLRCQRQIDEDGTECGVSRQAVDEAIDAIAALRNEITAMQERLTVKCQDIAELRASYQRVVGEFARFRTGQYQEISERAERAEAGVAALKGEIAELVADNQGMSRINDEFKAEVAALRQELRDEQTRFDIIWKDRDALRQDAERYRYAQRHPTFIGWDADYRPDEVDKVFDVALVNEAYDVARREGK